MKYIIAVVLAVLVSGCATSQGQVGSNAAYVYKKTADGCEVTVYTGREQVELATISINKDCELEGQAKVIISGQTNAALIGFIDRLIPPATDQ